MRFYSYYHSNVKRNVQLEKANVLIMALNVPIQAVWTIVKTWSKWKMIWFTVMMMNRVVKVMTTIENPDNIIIDAYCIV